MNVELISINPTQGVSVVSATDAARAQRDAILKDAGTVTTVADRLDADAALPVLRSLKAFLVLIEDHRVVAKEPALDIGRKIDALARELMGDVKVQESRIGRLLGAFEKEEQRKADEARQAAAVESARIAFEATKAELAARRAAPTPEAAARASDAISGAAAVKIAEVRSVAAAVVAPKADGTQIRSNVCFEVTDIKALYAARPEMVTLEPNGTVIRSICKNNPDAIIPGLKHWTEAKLSTS